MTSVRSSLLGVGLGATSMFLLDPTRGARRRALVRDKMVRASRKTAEAAGATIRDIGNRIEGVQSRTRSFFSDEAVGDATIEERVKSALGRVTAHHRAISVRASSGWVMLTGDALERESQAIIAAVERVRGVSGVQNNVRLHLSADRVPVLQGDSRVPRQWASWISGSWSPTALVTGSVAIAVATAALMRSRLDTDAAAVTDW